MNDFSRKSLLAFLDYLGDKGMIKQATVSARKAAASAILGILDEEEASDVRKLDVDDLMQRFSNLQGAKFTPGSLQTYKSRFNSALDDFLRYRSDPLNFKPAISARAARSKPKVANKESGRASGTASAEVGGGASGKETASNGHAGIVCPIPLRPSVVIQIAGIPSDLSKSEANKICRLVSALAIDGDDD